MTEIIWVYDKTGSFFEWVEELYNAFIDFFLLSSLHYYFIYFFCFVNTNVLFWSLRLLFFFSQTEVGSVIGNWVTRAAAGMTVTVIDFGGKAARKTAYHHDSLEFFMVQIYS